MKTFKISSNNYLKKPIQAFYHTNYTGMGKPGNPDYLNKLKNTYNTESVRNRCVAVTELKKVLLEDLPKIFLELKHVPLTVCTVPRAKSSYYSNQLLFKSTIQDTIKSFQGIIDGTDYICRHTNTKTTHLKKVIPNYDNDGKNPYPGITKETCTISPSVQGCNILLIDDIYTKNVNIDEDAIQALLDNKATSVSFYSIGYAGGR